MGKLLDKDFLKAKANQKCTHKFVFLRNESHYKAYRYSNTFYSVDYFFFEKCLEEQKKERSESVNIGNERPDWAVNISQRIVCY